MLRKRLATRPGKIVTVVVVTCVVALVARQIMGYLDGDTPEEAKVRMYICSETGKTFRHELKMGESMPVLSPHSGKNTGVPAEPCFWTADGGIKSEPTWVLVNEFVGKPEPTFCPDCGRLVVGHNPPAQAGAKPPPTRAEYKPRDRRDPAARSDR